MLADLNSGNYPSKRSLSNGDFGFIQLNPSLPSVDSCIDPPVTSDHLISKRSYPGGRVLRRQSTTETPGYTTSDDFGTDGDDTPHLSIPYYSYPDFFQSNASLPTNGSLLPDLKVDLIFLDYINSSVVAVLDGLGSNFSKADVSYYLPEVSTDYS